MISHKRPRSSYKMTKAYSSYKLPPAKFNLVIERYFESIDTPVGLACHMLFKYGEHAQLVSKSIDPANYNNAESFALDFAAISFLRKSQFLETGISLRDEALTTFREAEKQCDLTNRRFYNLSSSGLYNPLNASLLHAMVRKIERILSDVTVSDGFVDELLESGAFGPGASTLISGKDTSSVRKFREERQITTPLYRLIGPILERAYPLWFRDGPINKVEFRESSKVITVPKSAKTDRTIAVEPGLNIWFQKALGNLIRRRLRKNGLELNSDKKNQSLAKKGSKTGALATVDFSNASDTISSRVVEEVLPPLWFNLLDAARSKCYNLEGENHDFHKFSSMGNGFTFELESLLFYAAALSCTESVGGNLDEVSVFGDDVVLPSEAYDLFVGFSNFLGFSVNRQKSYSSGYFRESCGSYYYGGVDVKPIFLKKKISGAASVFNFANQISEFAHRRLNKLGRDGRFWKLHTTLTHLLPVEIRLKGDVTGGQGCIHSNFDECTPTRLRYGLEGYSFKAFLATPVRLVTDSPALLLARLRSPSKARESNNSYELRSLTRNSVSLFCVSRWYNFGPWIL